MMQLAITKIKAGTRMQSASSLSVLLALCACSPEPSRDLPGSEPPLAVRAEVQGGTTAVRGVVLGTATHDGAIATRSSMVAYQVTHVEQGLQRSVLYGDLLGGSNARRLSLKTFSRNVNTGWDWEESYTMFSTSFAVLDVSSRLPNYLYLLGRNKRNGVVVNVIEQWEVIPGSSVFGEPATYDALREELYRGNVLGDIKELEVDPEGRFLVLLHAVDPATGVGIVSQMGLSAVPSVSTLIPLAVDIKSISRIQHATEGRLWFLKTQGSVHVTTMADHDNDGSFDSIATSPYDAWVALNYFDNVVDDFVFQ